MEESWTLFLAIWRGGSPYISRILTAYRWWFLHFRYPPRSLTLRSWTVTFHPIGKVNCLPTSIFPGAWGVPELGGGNSTIFGIFTPNPGEMVQFDGSHIFQRGWWKTTNQWNIRNETNPSSVSTGWANHGKLVSIVSKGRRLCFDCGQEREASSPSKA